VHAVVYARHVEDPEFIGGREPFGPELNAERLKAEGLMGCKSPVCEPCVNSTVKPLYKIVKRFYSKSRGLMPLFPPTTGPDNLREPPSELVLSLPKDLAASGGAPHEGLVSP
jgi:hypothetical protein